MITFAPARPLWKPRPILSAPARLAVRYETALCDRHGRIERVLQRGRNTITNWGMDQLASQSVYTLINYLNLSSTQDTRKRQLQGGNQLTLTYTSESNIGVVADSNFFEAADAGRTLVVPGVPELKITVYTSQTQVTCATPGGFWLPGFTPPGAPTAYSSAAVYYTNTNTLASHFTKFNTYDAGGQTQSTDNSNSRFVHQRIYLSGVVAGSDWTVNQLGWSDGNGSNNCFGVANLPGADTVPVGKRYRVALTVYSGYTPVDLSGVSADWGATIGTYTLDIRQEYIGLDDDGSGVPGTVSNLLQPHSVDDQGLTIVGGWTDNAYALVAPYWQGQTGGTQPPGQEFSANGTAISLGSYTNGQFTRTKNIRWSDLQNIVNATALTAAQGGGKPWLTLKPQSGTITKPSGFWADITLRIFWTRDLPV